MTLIPSRRLHTAPVNRGNRASPARYFAHVMAAGLGVLTAAQAQTRPVDAVSLDLLSVEGEGGNELVRGYVARNSRAGSKTDTPLHKTPQSVSVVPRQQMEDQSVKSVAEALRYTAGVLTEYRGSSNLHDEIYVRGLSYVPRYLDGLLYGSGSFGQIDPYLLERVEVLKGPASVLYGQTNPGGIINLVSKMPQFVAHREIFLGTGNRARAEGGFDVGGPVNPHLAYRLVGLGLRVDGQEDHVQQQRVAIAPSFTWRPSDQTRLTVLGSYQYEPNAGFRNFLAASGTRYATAYGYVPRSFFMGDPTFDKYERTQTSIGYQFEHRFDDWVTFRQNARYSVIDTDFRTLVEWSIGSGANANLFTRKAGAGPERLAQFVMDNQVQLDVITGPLKQKILIGLDYQQAKRDYRWGYARGTSTIDWTNPVYGNPGDINVVDSTNTQTRRHQVGVYGQDQIEIDRLNLLFGIRHDWASTEVTDRLDSNAKETMNAGATTWRTGAIYNFDSGIAPYASYSTSFEPTLEAPQTGQAAFKPTEGKQLELGVKYAPRDAPYQLSAAYFDLTQQNILTRASYADPYTQIGEIRNRGFEFEARAEVADGLSVIGSVSHIESEVTESEDTTILNKTPARVPRKQGSLWAKYDVRGGWLAGFSLGGGVRYIGESWGNNINTFKVPEVTLLDTMVSYDFGRTYPSLEGLHLQLNASNLTDRRYVASCASAGACFYGSGRVITARLRYRW